MLSDVNLKLLKTSFESSPMECAYEGTVASRLRAKQDLHTKGFGGGVPQTPKQPP